MASNGFLVAQLVRPGARSLINHVQRRTPVNVPPTTTGKRRFRLDVETDPHKLVNYCCGINFHIDEPLVKLKPDEEYPDWLWNLRLDAQPPSWELEHGTKEYYLQLAAESKDRNKLLKRRAEKPKKIVGAHIKKRLEYIHHLRFAALAYLEEDAGLDQELLELDWQQASLQPRIRVKDHYLPMLKNRILYADKIDGNWSHKNYYRDPDSSFIPHPITDAPLRPHKLEAIQDSKRRHLHSVN